MQMSVIGIPTVLWTNNKNSIIRRQDPERDAATKDDFLNAMLLSAEFVLERKGRIDHLQGTVERMAKQVSLNEKETEKLNKLLKYIRREL
jgi:hypothetical protein